MTYDPRANARALKRRRLLVASGADLSNVPAGPYRERLAALGAEGYAWETIGRAVGVSGTGVKAIALGRTTTVKRPVAAKLRHLTRARIHAKAAPWALVPNVGVIRRLNALRAIGWTWGSLRPYGLVVGLPMTRPGLVTAETHRKVSALYDRLWHVPGPSDIARRRAAHHAPPMAWDDDSIDDPAATPAPWRDLTARGKPRTARSMEHTVEDVEHLVAAGENLRAVAWRLRVDEASLKDMLRRAGRWDLLAALTERAS